MFFKPIKQLESMVFPLAVNAKAGDSDGARRDTRQRFICSPLDTLETASGGVIF